MELHPFFARLMLKCLDANPLNRPTASQLYECLGSWVTAICDDPDPSDLSNEFDAAEEIKIPNLETFKTKIFYRATKKDSFKVLRRKFLEVIFFYLQDHVSA